MQSSSSSPSPSRTNLIRRSNSEERHSVSTEIPPMSLSQGIKEKYRSKALPPVPGHRASLRFPLPNNRNDEEINVPERSLDNLSPIEPLPKRNPLPPDSVKSVPPPKPPPPRRTPIPPESNEPVIKLPKRPSASEEPLSSARPVPSTPPPGLSAPPTRPVPPTPSSGLSAPPTRLVSSTPPPGLSAPPTRPVPPTPSNGLSAPPTRSVPSTPPTRPTRLIPSTPPPGLSAPPTRPVPSTPPPGLSAPPTRPVPSTPPPGLSAPPARPVPTVPLSRPIYAPPSLSPPPGPPSPAVPRPTRPPTHRPPIAPTRKIAVGHDDLAPRALSLPVDSPQIKTEPTAKTQEQIERRKEFKSFDAKRKPSKKDFSFSRLLKGSKKDVFEDRLADYLKDLSDGQDASTRVLFNSIVTEVEKLDTWSSKEEEPRDWLQVEVDENTLDEVVKTLIDCKKTKSEGFHFEFGRNDVIYNSSAIEVEHLDKDIPYYKEFMVDQEHLTYMGSSEDDPAIGAVILSMESTSGEEEEKRAILRTKKVTERFFIPARYCISSKEMVKYVKSIKPELTNIKLVKTPFPEVPPKLVEYDNQMVVKRYKFGILYVKEGQTDENQMFSNVHEGCSPEYEEFLNFIGERITLQGWDKYRGGLDVKNNATGLQSVYAKHRDYEIMFHVSTLLPFQPDDLQRVERKRHLGNDIVCILYKDGDTPFDPLWLTTHFTNIFLVIQRDLRYKDKTYYKLAIANKTGVLPYGPYLHSPPVYEKTEQFRDFLLTKLINSERAAMISPDFKGKMIRTNKQLLEEMANTFIEKARENRRLKSALMEQNSQQQQNGTTT